MQIFKCIVRAFSFFFSCIFHIFLIIYEDLIYETKCLGTYHFNTKKKCQNFWDYKFGANRTFAIYNALEFDPTTNSRQKC